MKPHLWKDIFNLRAAVRQRLGCAQVLNYVFFFRPSPLSEQLCS